MKSGWMVSLLVAAVSSPVVWAQVLPAGAAPAAGAATIPAAMLKEQPKPGTVYNVKDFGAKADGTTKDTAAFQKALDMCAVNGGGEVLAPAGGYLIGSIQIGSRTLLRLEKGTTLTGSTDVADYPMVDVRWEGRWQPGHRGLIYAATVDHIGIVGPGTIVLASRGTNDGGPSGPRNPVVLEPVSCTDVTWQDFTVQQGGNWATHPVYCTDLVAKGITIRSGRDGMDVDSCKGVKIEDCTMETGDDCISLKSGRGMDGARLAKPTEDVLITGCTLTDRTFACLGIGSETSGGVKNVRLEHCKLNAPRSAAIYVKTRIGRAGGNEDIACDDLDVTADTLLHINLVKGGNTSTADDPVEGISGYPYGKNISVTNARVQVNTLVKATEISARRPLEGLTLSNITGTCKKGMTIANATGVVLKDIKVTGFTGALLGIVNVTGTGLEGAEAIAPPVDPAPGNSPGGRGGFGGRGGGRGGFGGRGGRGGAAPAAAPATMP